ncbi:MAG TPA: hypothetical protein VH280_13265 [Verrucomicrobiae bacterium]|jgi:hypothetical protein|nr:hypothetical protein [Verrucomicrobiae bacterium]
MSISIPKNFDWPLAYEGEKFIRARLAEFLANNTFARRLAARMHDETGTDFFEWVDHLVLSPDEETALVKAGFVHDKKAETPDRAATGRERCVVLEHPQATLPRVLLRRGKTSPSIVAIKPEFVADFIAANHLAAEAEGEPRSRYRRVIVSTEKGAQLEAVERRAYRGFVPAKLKNGELAAILKTSELFVTRPRYNETDAEGFVAANKRLRQAIKLVGRDVACHLFFEAERAWWERRNRAARFQKFRQDTLGLGWGNHDHHTFRCSRAHFSDLIRFLVTLGFHKRERFYAGAEAGWGAQIAEQPVTGIVVFADVDLMPEETSIDFSVSKLPPASKLGTVGLWTGLHGESFLQAGMHHLEARFDFASLRDQLQANGLNVMKPFSDFEFLRQAFTEGERWPVNPERADHLASAGLITPEQREKFIREGAIGSHLENLQRHGGFKGFNQKSVSAVIAATDPRKQSAHTTPA